MDGLSSSNHRAYVSSGQNLGVIDGKAYNVSNVYVVRSNVPPRNSTPSPGFKVGRTKKPKSSSWLNNRELKRKKRIAMYKWYAAEGKVKGSFKKGLRWLKHTCNKIVHGF
ncbi:hypothetical protein RJ639_029711 [Escallonia herrerae]|uniref:Uncharacterized protein n=1 Tax=Escallonia herrerae TaxID=1293975 RepID=A0AA88WZ77_9ASTE|nr:hypothetical protein RJ639_029711 [Escallonia herrerae]